MVSYARRVLVLGGNDVSRRSFVRNAVDIAYGKGYRGTAYLVGMDEWKSWEHATGNDIAGLCGEEMLSGDALAMLNTGALFDRLEAVERIASGFQDVIIVHDWLCSYPVFDPGSVSENVVGACERIYGSYMNHKGFDYVVAVDKDSEHVPHLEWLEKHCGRDWESVVDFEGYPEGLALLIAGA